MSKTSYVAAHVKALPFSGIRKFFDIVASRADVISLGVGEPDFDTPWTVREAAVFSLVRRAMSMASLTPTVTRISCSQS